MTNIRAHGPGWRLIAKTTAGHAVLLAAELDELDAERRLGEIADLMDGDAVRRTFCTELAVVALGSIEAVEIQHYRPMHARSETTR
ncbi:hypothetical protein G6031_09495 [Dietzia sp. CQ4]|uniref:hypothetical protein n=1 Tax=Dietzia sp. (strain CQ4) TaxID=370437 RepID=UPI0015F9A05D|nr:hypothetical protein [Dietzia sp. CQ4]MBB1034621.1 hypothetical protein [Dietzia sp. CQ4]